MTQKKIEDKSLKMTIIVNCIVAGGGIWIYNVTKIEALFLDCFFSVVSLVSAIIGMILARISKEKTKGHPGGLYFLEPFYAIIEALLIFIVLGQSLTEATIGAYQYFTKGIGNPMNTTSVLPYTISMVILCFGIGYYNKLQNSKMNNISTMLSAESKSNFIDGIQSLGIGVAILVLYMVNVNGPFGFLHYTSDFFITLVIVIFSIKDPIELLKQGFDELTGAVITDKKMRAEIVKIASDNLDPLIKNKKYEVYKVGMHIKLNIKISDKINENLVTQISQSKERIRKELRKKYQSVEINCVL